MNVILCTSDKRISFNILKFLVHECINIRYVLVSDINVSNSYLNNYCAENKIEIIQGKKYEYLLSRLNETCVDLLISFNYPLIIPKQLIERCELAINFHPAPLPDYRGTSPTSWGILKDEKTWAVSCHLLDEGIDSGDIIDLDYFDIDKRYIKTGKDLSEYCWNRLEVLLKKIIRKIEAGESLSTKKNVSVESCYTREMLNSIKEVNQCNSAEEISKRIKALWYPPFEGAYIILDGKKFYLIDQEILNEYGEMYQQLQEYNSDCGGD